MTLHSTIVSCHFIRICFITRTHLAFNYSTASGNCRKGEEGRKRKGREGGEKEEQIVNINPVILIFISYKHGTRA